MNTTQTAPQVTVKVEMQADVAAGVKVVKERSSVGRMAKGYRVYVIDGNDNEQRVYRFSERENGKANDYYLTLMVEMAQRYMRNCY